MMLNDFRRSCAEDRSIQDSLRAVPPKNVLPYWEHSHSWSACRNPVRFYSNECDPCKSQDVYKVSPLCPPRGYAFRKSVVSLKCPKKTPCKVEKKAKPKTPVKIPDQDCLKKPEKKECPKEVKTCKKEDKKASSKKEGKKKSLFPFPKKEGRKPEPPKKEEKKAVGKPDPPKKEEKKAAGKSEKCKKEEAKACEKSEKPKKDAEKGGKPEQSDKALSSSKNDDKKDCPKIGVKKESKKDKDCPKKADAKMNSEAAPKKVENPKCADPPGPPDCGILKECNIEKSKSVIPPIKPKKDNIRPPVAPECASKECKPPPNNNPACDIKFARAKALDPKPDPAECPCSVRPWPFSLFNKCKKKPDKKCQKKPDKKCQKKPDKKCTSKSIKKMVSVSHQNLFRFENSINYLRRKLIESNNSRLIHSCSYLNEPQPVCPQKPCPLCSKDVTISKETEKIMVQLRATARANKKFLPETCVATEQDKACLMPTKGWEPAQVFCLMRHPDAIKKSGGLKIIESPRLVSRRLRKRQ